MLGIICTHYMLCRVYTIINVSLYTVTLLFHQHVSVEVWVPTGTCHVTHMVDSAHALSQLRGWTVISAVSVTFALSIRTKHQTDVQVRIVGIIIFSCIYVP